MTSTGELLRCLQIAGMGAISCCALGRHNSYFAQVVMCFTVTS
jgi:hypothetical protein